MTETDHSDPLPATDPTTRGSLLPVVDEEQQHPPDDRRERPGLALCLSGGGYRAMLFHVGAVIRLNELGELRGVARVSSVSGGSIIGGIVNPFRTVSAGVARAYDRHLFAGATLQDLPSGDAGPRFVINATNVQTGKLFRFSRPYEGDWSIGLWRNPTTRLADAVTASSAFPPVLSPHVIKPGGRFDPATTGANRSAAFKRKIWLTDGGVYDNLGLETAFKQYRTILVSDGGGALGTDPRPKRDWARHGVRVAGIVDGQVRALRKRQIIGLYENGFRDGTYWSVRSDVANYAVTDPIEIPDAARDRARNVPTRLAKLDAGVRADLINWGYAIADAALRRWVFPTAAPPTRLPA